MSHEEALRHERHEHGRQRAEARHDLLRVDAADAGQPQQLALGVGREAQGRVAPPRGLAQHAAVVGKGIEAELAVVLQLGSGGGMGCTIGVR